MSVDKHVKVSEPVSCVLPRENNETASNLRLKNFNSTLKIFSTTVLDISAYIRPLHISLSFSTKRSHQEAH